MSIPRPSSSRRRAAVIRAHAAWLALLTLGLVGCGKSDPAFLFADFASHQLDNVTTRLVPAQADLAWRLTGDGWRRIEDESGASRLATTRDRVRIWFFSHDGNATAVELSGRLITGSADEPRRIACRINDALQSIRAWKTGKDTLTLPFDEGATRRGWNALDLYLKRQGPDAGQLELRGFRFLYGSREARPDEGPRRIEVSDDELTMPAESYLDAAFEVPRQARLTGRARAEGERLRAEGLHLRIELSDAEGRAHEIVSAQIEDGDSIDLDADLSAWEGETARLRLVVDGPRGGSLRLEGAGVSGLGTSPPTGPPITPSMPPLSGRLAGADIVIIVLDAARADAFGAYGAEHPTPSIDALAEEGTRFAHALSPSSWTGQSIPALLAGFYPDTLHTERWGDALPAKTPNVAELMAAEGYRTVLFSQHPIYNRADSLTRGFEEIHYSGRRKRNRLPTADLLFEEGRPTFAIVHLLPPHSPYAPPAPFRGRYTSSYDGDLPPKLGAIGRIGKSRDVDLEPRDIEYVRNRYLENVAFADRLVGRIAALTKKAGRYDDSLLIVTSDHGEAFFEHGQFMHSRELYQEFLHIPLVVKWPRASSGFAPVVEDSTSLVDILPTLVDGLGLEGAVLGFQGRSLLPATFDGVALERPVYATTRGLGDVDKNAKPRWMLQDGDWRIIHDPIADDTELYRISSDPGEQDDLAESHPARAALMLQRLLTQRSFNVNLLDLGGAAAATLDPDLVEELKALGYL